MNTKILDMAAAELEKGGYKKLAIELSVIAATHDDA